MEYMERRINAVGIEIAGMCNAKCPYCSQRRLERAKNFGKFISPELFEQILNHLLEVEIISELNPPPIQLYVWGEPFLHPQLNEILHILKKKKFLAQISTNFIKEPDIDDANLSALDSVTFSLSGFTQESYDKIHGASLDRVLKNFDNFYERIRQYSPKTAIYIAWHRYTFNEGEFWQAYKFFNRPGIDFSPALAYLVDLPEMMDFVGEKLSKDRCRQAESDLFLNDIRHNLEYCSKTSTNYHCPGLDLIIINEIGQLMICCCVTRGDSEYILGNILEMSAEEIWKAKFNNQLCIECTSSGLAKWFWNQRTYNKKPWPPGGGLGRLHLWSSNFKILYYGGVRAKIGQLLRKLPKGEKLINVFKSFEGRS